MAVAVEALPRAKTTRAARPRGRRRKTPPKRGEEAPAKARRQRSRSTALMIPELGHFSLILALLIAVAQALFPLVGAARGSLAWMSVARSASLGQLLFVAIAFVSLTYAFVSNDFSVLYF